MQETQDLFPKCGQPKRLPTSPLRCSQRARFLSTLILPSCHKGQLGSHYQFPKKEGQYCNMPLSNSCNLVLIVAVILSLKQIGINSIQVLSNSNPYPNSNFPFEYGSPLVKVSYTKVVPNVQIYLHAKFHIFLGSPIISFQFISHLPGKSNWKREIKLKNPS
jgi:hypothetical protein